MTKTDLLDRAYGCPPRDFDVVDLPEGSRSAITGAPIPGDPPQGVEADSLLTNASSAPHEIFPYQGSNYVSEAGARCYKHFRGGLTGNLLAVAGDPPRGYKPMVSTKSAEKKDRPNWQRVIYGTDEHAELSTSDRCLAIFTEEFQRRLWLEADVSIVGSVWRPYLYYGSVVRALRVRYRLLRGVLALCEYVYSLGFTKDNLLNTLFGSTKKDLCLALGLSRARELDDTLARYRDSDELLLATFVCQRAKGADPEQSHSSNQSALEAPESYQWLIPSPTNSSKVSRKKPPTPKTSPAETEQRDLFA
jgi:hypothetical protein